MREDILVQLLFQLSLFETPTYDTQE